MGIGRILIPEFGTSSEIGRILIPELVRGRVCFLGSVRTERVFLHGPFYPTHPTHETFFFFNSGHKLHTMGP